METTLRVVALLCASAAIYSREAAVADDSDALPDGRLEMAVTAGEPS